MVYINNNFKLVGHSDSDYAKDLDDRKSIIGFVLSMGDIAFSWTAKK